MKNAHKSQSGSVVYLDEWVSPEIVDGSGYLRPGKILEWMDVVGVIASSRYSKAPVVTASIDGLSLNHPVEVGARITLSAKIGFTSNKTMGVCVSMDHIKRNDSKAIKNTVKGYMVFVALDKTSEKPMPVPAFIPGSSEEQQLFQEGQIRHDFRKKKIKENWSTEKIIEESSNNTGHFKIREFLKLLPNKITAPWESQDLLVGERSRHHSYIHKIEPVFSGQLNFTGSLYGGTLVKWVETSAHLSARAYLDGMDVVMTALHGLNFLSPVKQNVFLHIRSNVVHRSKNSITVLTEVQSEDPIENETLETLRAFMTYRPLKNIVVPKLELKTDDDKKLFDEVKSRIQLQKMVYGSEEGRAT